MAVAPANLPALEAKPCVAAVPGISDQPQTRLLSIGICLLLLAFSAFVALEYHMPEHYRSTTFGVDMMGLWHFQDHLRLTALRPMDLPHFRTDFRLLLCLIWAGYALAVIAGLRGAKLAFRPLIYLLIVVAVSVAVFCPPMLSADLYAYLGYGRLAALYGQNPYIAAPNFLVAVHDPISHFMFWNLPDVYGPVWTRLTIAVVALHPAGLWPEALGMKLIEAAAVVTMGLAGRGIARHVSPGHENLTLLAIGLNPLLLLEGPGSGHNDLLLLAFLMLGAMFFLDGKYLLASLCLGLSVGVKLITLTALPWLLMEACRDRSMRQRFGFIFGMTALALLPTVVCYGTFWAGLETLAAIQQRSTWGLSAAEQFWRHGLIATVYLALTIWLWRRPAPGAWLRAWGALAAVLMFAEFALPFPWYAAWFLPVLLTRWDKTSLSFSAAGCALAILWGCRYAALIPYAPTH